jgi:DNA-binding SARP family transcriptional activator
MEFRILGPLYADARTGSGPAVISQPLLQSALAVLLLRANRPCPRSMLIEALWGAEPPGSPEAALRVCISRLRRSLGGCATRLDSVGPPGGRAPGHRQQRGYMMTVRPGELDVDEFTDLVAQGQAELDTGNAPAAAASFVQALALWGDPPLPDLPDCEVLAAPLARLRNQRQAAIDALFDARLAAGEHEQVLGQLRAAVSATPGRERTCAQLMRAYHALGMHTEALDVYQQAREVTLEQQGAEPGPVLAVLYQRILAEELTTDRQAHVGKLGSGGLTMPASQAPAPPPDFAGRSDEVAHVVEYLSGPGVPVVVITGGPGMGKSATAAVVALQLRRRFTDGQIYAELGGVEHPRDPQDVLADILQSLGVPAHTIPLRGPARAAMYRSVLASRKILVIVDDAAYAAQVRHLVPAAGGAAVLVTSRSPLTGLAGGRQVSLGELPPEDALTLLDMAAGPGRIGAEQAAAAKVVAACAGMPLAIRLAGAVLAARPGLTLTRLARDCTTDHLLDAIAAEDSSVRGAIDSSYRALPGAARAALALAATWVPDEIPAWALTVLAQGDASVGGKIVGVGLLMPAEAEVSGQRFRMHRLVRAYGREQASDHGQGAQDAATREPAALRPVQNSVEQQPDPINRAPDAVTPEPDVVRRLRAGWMYLADQAALRLPAIPFVARPAPLAPGSATSATSGTDADENWLDSERANLLMAVHQAATAGDHSAAVALASRLIAHQCITGAFAGASKAWRAIVAAAASAGDARYHAIAEYYLAVALAESHERVTEAAALLAGAVPELERAGERDIAAMAYALRARCASADGRHAAAIRAARQAIQLGGPEGDLARCCATAVLGLTLARVGMTQAGIEQCQQAQTDARQLRQPAYEAYATRALAQGLILGGLYTAAASACGDGIELARQHGSDIAVARFMLLLGRARQCDGDRVAAAASLQSAAEIFMAAGLPIEEVTARSMLAACRTADGDRGEAAVQVQQVSQILERRGIADADARSVAAMDASQPTDQLPFAETLPLIAG